MKVIFDFNRTLFNPEIGSLYVGVVPLLEELCRRHELLLITRNEATRHNLIESMGIAAFFREILFTDKKTPEVFLSLAGKRSDVMVIGDRISEEIRVGNMLGFITVHVKHPSQQGSETLPGEKKPDFSIDDIREIAEIITHYEM